MDSNVMDSDTIEQKAREYASDMAGEYLSTINWTNMNNDEWMELINVITKNYELEKIRLTPCPF